MEEKKPRGLTLFFTRYGKIFIGFSLLVLAIVFGVVVFNEIEKQRIAEATQLIEAMESAYEDYLQGEDSLSAETELEELAAQASVDFGQDYPAQRGQFLLAMKSEQKEDFLIASELFEASAKINRSSQLAEVGFIRAYQTAEAGGEIERAVEMLEALLLAIPNGVQAPRAIFNLGRLYELLENKDLALETYKRLALEFPGSSWTSLSEARILILEKNEA